MLIVVRGSICRKKRLDQLLKYQLYREHNRKPALIIQNADYMTIRVMSDIRNQHESEQFFPLCMTRL